MVGANLEKLILQSPQTQWILTKKCLNNFVASRALIHKIRDPCAVRAFFCQFVEGEQCRIHEISGPEEKKSRRNDRDDQ